ncbi:MAG TPA: uroporphyrinogen-III C-methyltransferase [Gammaproteobacteria bacterium]|nr:uroporphyrinogen-III C-methyltransferase [Gammaproteobacteria bacterium]
MKPLENFSVLITRPGQQGKILCDEITSRGGQALYFPTIEFAPPLDSPEIKELEPYDWIIFISPHAVKCSRNFIHRISPKTQFAAPGAGTAQALREEGLQKVFYPEKDWSSEGLLALPCFQNPSHQKILIVRGEGGRDLLTQTLVERGANVEDLIVYRRIVPTSVNLDFYLALLQQQKIDIIVCTSGESLHNLLKIIETNYHAFLFKIRLIVGSRRLEALAKTLGFQQAFLAENASHHAIIKALYFLKEKKMTVNNEIEQTNTSPKKPRLFWANMGILLAGAATGIFIAALLWANYTLLGINNHFANALTFLQNNLDESKNKMTDAEKIAMTTQQSLQQTNETLKTQTQIITDLQKTQKNNKDDYLAQEALYLIKLANDSLQYENNVPLAIKLVQSADQDIAKLSDPKVYPVREAIAVDLVALQSAPQVDVAGLYVRLSAISEQIDKLSMKTQLLTSSSAVSADTNNETLSWWRRGLNSIEQALQRIIIVRKNVPNVPPFIAPDQKIFLYQNLQAELEKAQWGLLHHQQEIYRLSLLTASNWIKQYADSSSSVTAQILQNLQQLQLIDIHPSVPNLNNSLQALQNYSSNLNA